MRIVCIGLLILVSGCASRPIKIETIELPVSKYVAIPAELLKRCAWPKKAPLRDVIAVNRIRKACLEQYEGQFDGINTLQQEGAGAQP